MLLNEISTQHKLYDCEALVVLMDSIYYIFVLIILMNPNAATFKVSLLKTDLFLFVYKQRLCSFF